MPVFDLSVTTPLPNTYRVNRVHSLFNVTGEQAATHTIHVDLPFDAKPWRVGAVIGPSGTGKSTLGRALFGAGAFHEGFTWGPGPIIDEVGPDQSFDEVCGAFSAVGLGTVPSWLRPFHVLSTGEKFRADLARLLIERDTDVVIDEFTASLTGKSRRLARRPLARRGDASRRAGPLCSPAITILLIGCNPIGCLIPGNGNSHGGYFNDAPRYRLPFMRRIGAPGRILSHITT